MKKIYINKALFVQTIEAIKKQEDHDNKCRMAFRTILPDAEITTYDNHHLQNQLVKLLQVAFDDEHSDSWIEYFLWELDFGRKYRKGCVIDKDKKPICLSNAGKLYEFLIKNLNQ